MRLVDRGYVLVMTLVLLALMVLALTGTVRLSLRRASEAQLAQQQLQHRWGMLSCQHTLLPRTEEFLSSQQLIKQRPLASVRRTIQLGGTSFELIFADEQAKANANVLLQRRGKQNAERILRELLIGSPLAGRLQLRPFEPQRPARTALPLIGDYGQIIEFTGIESLLQGDEGQSLAGQITCWGDGRLNFRRASEQALRSLACPPLDSGRVQQMLNLRATSPQLSLSQVLDRMQLSTFQHSAAEASLSEGSGAQSLWIIVRSPRRSWYRLAIQQRNQDGTRSVDVFEW